MTASCRQASDSGRPTRGWSCSRTTSPRRRPTPDSSLPRSTRSTSTSNGTCCRPEAAERAAAALLLQEERQVPVCAGRRPPARRGEAGRGTAMRAGRGNEARDGDGGEYGCTGKGMGRQVVRPGGGACRVRRRRPDRTFRIPRTAAPGAGRRRPRLLDSARRCSPSTGRRRCPAPAPQHRLSRLPRATARPPRPGNIYGTKSPSGQIWNFHDTNYVHPILSNPLC